MKQHLRTAIGILLSVLLLAWAMRDVSAAEVAREIRHADPLLFALSIVVVIAGIAVRALRWGVLLQPVAPRVPFRPRYAAVMIGFALNNLIPARIGEIARGITLPRISRVPVGASFATLVVERIFDALVLVALLFAAMATPDFPLIDNIAGVDPRSAAAVVAVVMVGTGVVLFGLVVAPTRALLIAQAVAGRTLPPRFGQPLVGALRSFLEGLAVLRSGRLFAVSLGLAFAQWIFTALSYSLAFWAFGIDVPFAGAIFLQSLIALAVAVPSSPGFFGPFEAAAKLGLALWAVAPEKAVSFAVGYHLGGFIPVTLIGLYYIWRLGLSWTEIRKSGEGESSSLPLAPPPGLMLREGV